MVDTARAGNGSCNLVKRGDSNLKAKVINALKKACEPAFTNCRFVLQPSTPLFHSPDSGNVGIAFRHDLITYSAVINKSDFSHLSLNFSYQEYKSTNVHETTFQSSDFKHLADGDELFKLAAH